MSQIERFSTQEEAALNDWLKAKEIKVALFDLDSTLIRTNEVFLTQTELFFQFCRNTSPELDMDQFRAEFLRIDKESYLKNGISPKTWNYIVGQLCEIYQTPEFGAGLEILLQTYQIPPQLFDGAKETLSTFKNCDIRIGLVTHAAREYTDLKVDAHELRPYFEFIMAIDPDENFHKEAKHWQEAVDTFGVSKNNVIVVGDSLGSDIRPASAAGITNLVWIKSEWQSQNIGEIPQQAVQIENIAQLIPTLLSIKD